MTANREPSSSVFGPVFDLRTHGQSPVIALCHGALRDALSNGAQAIQFIVDAEDHGSIRVQQQGRWEELLQYPSKLHRALVRRLKVMGGLHIDRRPVQEGQIRARDGDRELAIKIAVRRLGTGIEAVSLALPAAEVPPP